MAAAHKSNPKVLSGLFMSILQGYLHDDAEIAATAIRYTQPSHQRLSAFSGLQGSLWIMWATLIDLTSQTPHDSPAQQRLVNLLKAIQQVHVPEGHSAEVPGWHAKLWTDLPIFGATVREHVMDRTPDALMEEALRILPGAKYWKAKEMANIYSFLARVTTEGIWSFEGFALSFPGSALEEEPVNTSSFSTLDDHVPTAAVWILYAGRYIYNKCNDEGEMLVSDDPEEEGRVYHGPGGFCGERWAFWKMRFELVASYKTVGEDARTIAGEAFAKMVEIEGEV